MRSTMRGRPRIQVESFFPPHRACQSGMTVSLPMSEIYPVMGIEVRSLLEDNGQ